MLILWEQDAISLKHICDQLGQQPRALTPVLKRMGNEGLLARERGVANDRTLSIWLIQKGHQLKTDGLKVNQCEFEACDMAGETLMDLKNKLDELRAQIVISNNQND